MVCKFLAKKNFLCIFKNKRIFAVFFCLIESDIFKNEVLKKEIITKLILMQFYVNNLFSLYENLYDRIFKERIIKVWTSIRVLHINLLLVDASIIIKRKSKRKKEREVERNCTVCFRDLAKLNLLMVVRF